MQRGKEERGLIHMFHLLVVGHTAFPFNGRFTSDFDTLIARVRRGIV